MKTVMVIITVALYDDVYLGESGNDKMVYYLYAMFFCPSACINALGMDDRSIDNSQITASSSKPNYEPSNGRLNHIKTASKGGSWCSATPDKLQYLQIDLAKEMTISGIATQGAGDTQDWVQKYKLQKSDDGRVFNEHTEFGMPMVRNHFGVIILK